ncbi:hypothetical protein AVDCRST_MAG81-4931 [uncultured Synechococcales cyanobacterium]|uniref:Uncharacterized protein n=1 Tax=uncultured Synechococcales cyanobacterium TaxID=1936017 RepID=A0A6J4VYE2_9CYAN|nr:hypothetical protein AVDCRST_MAG81-4931 [uncultured Synechococcales cyanobacterium]
MNELLEIELDKTEAEKLLSKNVDASSERWHRYREVSLIALLGGIPHPVGPKLRRLLYASIFAHLGKDSYIQAGCEFFGGNHIEIGDAVKIHRDVRINMSSNSFLQVGNNVWLDRGVDINVAGEDCVIEIGNGSFLGPYVCMAGPGHIKIGKGCMIASQSGLYANNHRADGLSREGIEIGDNCWLGTGVKVLDGVKIGRGCVIGAGTVVTKNIPPMSVAVGVPAKVIKETKAEGRC